ncbi:ATP/GTP-binding protein [Streptomyces sp. NPDC001848]|uniref:ATP/GTP-binding protein n=1 Tax=Streptomyces sp. NPDC001848 TaxID=3364618 RepID=UPI003682E0C1
MARGRWSWRRLAAHWARAESASTRLLLLAIFVIGLLAQFVKPVGDALEGKAYLGGSLLSLVGYVLYAEVQRLNAAHDEGRAGTTRLEAEVRRLHEVHEEQRATADRLQAELERLSGAVQRLTEEQRLQTGRGVPPRDLETYFREALGARETQIAALGFTGETVVVPLRPLLQGLPPDPQRKVHLRFLVPDFTKPIEVPGLIGSDGRVADAPEFRQELVDKIRRYDREMRELIGRFDDKGWGLLRVEFRVMHMSPTLKLCLINDDQAFEGLYDKVDIRRFIPPSGDPHGGNGDNGDRLLDLLGYDTLLTRWHRDDGVKARTVIEARRRHFDILWNAAHPLSPNGTPQGAP